jgi:hypothetical protein
MCISFSCAFEAEILYSLVIMLDRYPEHKLTFLKAIPRRPQIYSQSLSMCSSSFLEQAYETYLSYIQVFACFITCVVGFSADRIGRRGYFNLCVVEVSHVLTANLLPVFSYRSVFIITPFFRFPNFRQGAVAYIILISSRNAALSYFAVYLATWSVPANGNC